MRRSVLVALALMSSTLAACEVFGAGPAVAACAQSARDYSGTLVASLHTSVGAVRDLVPGRVQPERWPDLARDQPAFLCYIDAEIAKGPPPGPDGEIPDSFNRAVIGIAGGRSELIMAGYRDQIPIPGR